MTHPSRESSRSMLLVVDNNPSALSMKSRILSRLSYRMIEASNGADALTIAAAERPALILLDVNLPDRNGFDVCRQLKSQPETQSIKVLQTSAARISASDRAKSLEAGADAYLVEPVEEEELIGTVRALLQLATQERDNRRLIEKLSRTERQLLDVIEAANCTMWDWDILTGKLEWFGMPEQPAGMSLGDFSGTIQAFTDALHPEDRAHARQKLDALMAGHETRYADEYRLLHPDGTVRWMSGIGRFYYDDNGKAVCMTGVAQDVTEKKQADARLRESEARLSSEVLSLARLNELSSRLWRTTSLRQGLDEMLTATIELLGADFGNVQLLDTERGVLTIEAQRGFSSDFLEFFCEVSAEDESACGRAFRAGERIVIEDIETDAPYAPMREIGRAAGYRAVQSTPLIACDGRPLGMLSTHWRSAHRPCDQDLRRLDLYVRQAADFIERCLIDDALRQSEMQFRIMADAAPVLIWMSDTAKRCTYFNQEWLDFTGRTLAQEIGDGWAESVHPDDYDQCLRTYVDAFDRRKPFTMEYRLRRADGRYGWMVDHAVPLWESGRKFRGYIGACVDITDRKQAEEKLRENHRFISKMTSVLPGMLYIFDLQEQRNVYVNRHPGAVLGYSAEDIHALGADFIPTVLHPDDAIRLLQHFEGFKELHDGVTMQVEYRLRHWDGSYRWFLSRDVIWQRTTEGHVQQILGIATDITERKMAEEALFESEERLGGIISTAMDAILSVDSRQRITLFNRAAEQLFGCPAEEALGQPLDRFIPERYRTRHLAHMDAFGRTGVTSRRMGQYGLVFGLRADGREFPAEASISHLNVRGGKLYTVIMRDVSERVESEKTLREREQRLRHHVANAGLAVIEWDAQWIVTRWEGEAECMFGWTAQEMLGRHLPDLKMVYDDDISHVQRVMTQLSDGVTRTLVSCNRNYTKHGRVIHCIWHNSVLLDGDGRLSSVLSLVQDNTDHIEAEAALRSLAGRLEQLVDERTRELVLSQDRLRALASELSLAEQRERKRLAIELHDHLQQMLVVGKLTIGQGKRAASGVPAYESILKKVDDILSDALTYSRTLVVELSPPVLRDHGLATSLKWLAEYMKKKHEHIVTIMVPNEQLNLPEEQHVLLFQSVRELLINSAKYAGTGQATLTMEQQADQLCITVRDEGNGFDLAAVATAGTPSGGIASKFGLFSIQERMLALGGSFDIQSAIGKGTIAILKLPLAFLRSSSSESVAVNSQLLDNATLNLPHSKSSPTNVRVLLVDDHAMVRQGLRSVLDAYADIQVVGEARDGVEAIKLVKELQPRVVVMDINMPKMNGIEATMQVKTKWPETTIIGISVNIESDNRDAMRRAGASMLLTKEAAVEQLYDAIIQEVGAQKG